MSNQQPHQASSIPTAPYGPRPGAPASFPPQPQGFGQGMPGVQAPRPVGVVHPQPNGIPGRMPPPGQPARPMSVPPGGSVIPAGPAGMPMPTGPRQPVFQAHTRPASGMPAAGMPAPGVRPPAGAPPARPVQQHFSQPQQQQQQQAPHQQSFGQPDTTAGAAPGMQTLPRPSIPGMARPPGPPGALAPRPVGGTVPPGIPGMGVPAQGPAPPGGVQQPPAPGMMAPRMGGGPPPGGARPMVPTSAPQQPSMQPPSAFRPQPGPGMGPPPPPGVPGMGPPPPLGAPAAAYAARPGMPGMPPPGPPGMMPRPPPMSGGLQPPPAAGIGYDAAPMQAALDSFATLSLGPAAPSMPGQPADDASSAAAAFPRPAGPGAEEAVGPPQPYTEKNCKPQFMRVTTQAVPNSQALKARWHLPFGAVVHPMSEALGEVPVANPGVTSIIRCKRCRTYMNPFMSWTDGGRRFVCNVCQMMNEVPVEFFCALDANGRRLDYDQRPELKGGSVEYIAPAEYMVRPPMPPSYVFVIDVSFAAVANGMLHVACAAIKDCLDNLPGDERTQIAFITFDSTIHFYNLKSSLQQPQMMVVAEVEEPFVPLPDDLLVNLKESRHVVDALLESLPQSFARTQCVESAMGPALQAAFLVANHIGGKLLLFQTASPSLGIGRIKARDNPAMYGTDREYTLRCPDDPFYKRFSAEASRFQICVDVFAFGSTYMDLPSLGALPKYTGGQLYYYPGFNAEKDGVKLTAEIKRNLLRETAWEAVMRIRCSKGLRINAFYGHFFIRSTDLLALPACDSDKSFAVEIQHEETLLTGQVAYIQAALLYTNSNGERRIRVHTMALPVVSDLIELYKASDAGGTAALLAKISVERSYAAKLDDVRMGIQQRLVAALREYRMLHMRGQGMGVSPNSMVLPERLKSFPVLCLGLSKVAALRGSGRDVNSDERTAVGQGIMTGSTYDILKLIYPNCYPVYESEGGWGLEGADGRIQLPPTAPAGLEYFNPAGAYLIDNGRVIVLWLGQSLHPQFFQEVFGSVPSNNSADMSALNPEPVRPGSKLSQRINSMLGVLRGRKELAQECYVVRQGMPMEAYVMPYFIEDRMPSSGSQGYMDFMVQLQKSVMAK